MLKKVFLLVFVAGAMLTSCNKEDNTLLEDKTQTSSQTSTGDKGTPTPPKTPVAVKKIVYEAVQVERENNFYLNSATYLGLDGKTRISIPLRLPENTVRFYYTISTSAGKSPVQGLKLFTQITKLLDPTGSTFFYCE